MKLNELIEEEKSLRHVAMVVAKFLDLNTPPVVLQIW